MGINKNALPMVTKGLVLFIDAANPKSYPGSGVTAADLSGNSNNGTLKNGVAYGNGIFTFDGVDDYIDCGPVPQVGSTLTGLTVCHWVKTNVKDTKCLSENGTDYTQNTYYMFQENANNFTFAVYGGSGYDVRYSSTIYQTNTWYYAVGVWQTGVRNDFYLNGVLNNGTNAGNMQTTLRNGNTNLTIGKRETVGWNYNGNIPITQIYNRALTAAEVLQNYNTTKGRFGL